VTTAERAEARDEILALVYGYSDAIDRGDFDAVSELFRHGDFVVDGGTTPLRGDALGDWFRGQLLVYDDGTPHTSHVNPNVVVRVADDGRTARARSPLLVFQAVDGDIRCVFSGVYDDTFARSTDGWHFSSRRSTTRLVGDLSAHLIAGGLGGAPK
jgi:hypothetical protein